MIPTRLLITVYYEWIIERTGGIDGLLYDHTDKAFDNCFIMGGLLGGLVGLMTVG